MPIFADFAQDHIVVRTNNSPEQGDTLVYDTTLQAFTNGKSGRITSGDTPHSGNGSPALGDLWYDPITGRLYVYYDDTWVDASPQENYILPIASEVNLGGVKIGDNISIDGSGRISVSAPFSGSYNDLSDVPANLSQFNNDTNFITLSDLPISTTAQVGLVEIGTNIDVDGNGKISVSFAGLATETYVTDAITNNLNLGNFEINGTNLQTLSGTVNGADIILNPLNGSVKVNSLKFGDLGSVVNTTLNIEAYITTYRLVHIVDYSTTDALPTGQYGNINGVAAPWTVFELAPGTSGTPVSAVAINDKLTGAGIVPSTVADRGLAGVGDPAEWNNYVIVNLDLSQLGQVLPIEGEAVFNLTRPLEKANLNIQSATGTDIFLDSQGLGDVIVNTNILPVATNVSNLGSPTRRWKAVYVGPGTIYVQDETLGTDIAIGARDGSLYIQNGNGLKVGEFTFVDNQIKITDPARDIIVGSTGATASVVFNRAIKVKDSLGNLAFEVDRSGLTTIRTPSGISYQNATLSIIGTANGHVQPRPVDYDGTLIQLTAQDGKSSRISSDSFGTGVYPLYAGRAAAGTVDVPTAVQSGAILSRFSGVGYGTTAYKTGIIRLDMLAAETFTDTAAGTKFSFQTTPTGSTAAQLSATINSTGITFVGTTDTTAGITFHNGDRLTYFPTPAGNTNYYLKSNGSTMSWQPAPTYSGTVIFKGPWDATANSPSLSANQVGAESGWEYIVTVAGTRDLGNGSVTFNVGDLVIYDGATWNDIPGNQNTVTSIQFDSGSARTGVVQVVSSDIISTLDSNSIGNNKLANSSVTVTAGTGLSGGGTVSLGNTITLSNTGVTSIVNGTGISVSGTGAVTVTNTGIVTLTGSTYIGVTSGSTPTVSLTNASNNDTNNSVALRNNEGGLTAKDFTATLDAGLSTDHGPFNYGTLSYTDTGIMADFSYSTAGYNQIVLQNRYTGAATSTNYIVSNDQGTKDIFYGEFGMNSSGFSGTGSLTLPNAVYLNSVSSDLVLGGTGIHFVIDGGIDVVSITDTEIDTYNNYVLKDGSDNVLLQIENDTGIGKLTFGGGSQGIWYDSGIVINGVTYSADYYGIQPMSYNSSTGQVTYGLIDYTHLTGFPRAPSYADDAAANAAIALVSPGGTFYNTPQSGQTYFNTTLHQLKVFNGTAWVSSVASVTATGPISSSGGTTPNISISQASGSTSGYLSSTDWTTFNNKTSNTGTVTSIATSGTVSGLTLTGGTITTTGTITLGGTISGLTSSNLSNTAGIVNGQLANSTISGVALGGNLSTLTISGPLTGTSYNGSTAVSIGISQASGSVNGYLSSTDWTTFNNKTSNTGTVTSVAALTLGTTGTDLSSTVATGTTTPVITLNVPTASASNRGALSSADWTTFNNKVTSIGSSTLTVAGTTTVPTVNLTSGVVSAGTTGSSTLIPVVTVDTYGRVTGITTAANPQGTVTSITAGSTPVNGLSLSGGTITSAGTIAITGTLSGITNSNLSGTAGISNANLANSSVTVTAGTGMSGGGTVALGGSITLTNAGVTSIVAGTNVTVSGATGAVTINASAGVGGNQLVYVLDAVLSLASARNTLASIFGLTSGVTVTSNTRYQYELVFNLQANKTGVLSYALALGNSAAVAQHNYSFEGNTTTTIVGYTAGISLMSANATGAAITTAQTVADTLNGFAHYIVRGTIDVTTGGTVNFMISQDQNTPITWSVKPGAYIKLTPLGAIGANTAAGTWA